MPVNRARVMGLEPAVAPGRLVVRGPRTPSDALRCAGPTPIHPGGSHGEAAVGPVFAVGGEARATLLRARYQVTENQDGAWVRPPGRARNQAIMRSVP